MVFTGICTKITQSLESGETLSPFLFLGNNSELLHSQLDDFVAEILQHYDIPKTSVISLPDDGENLKIESIRNLLKSSSVKSTYQFQVFIIENISRLTLASSNSMLKFLEEPGQGNIIFLTNTSESGVLDTILSRVQMVPIQFTKNTLSNAFFADILQNINSQQGKQNLLSYVYSSKLEKSEYIDFLQTLLASRNIISPKQMQDLSEDIHAIQNNNVLPKYVVDTWIMQII